MEIIPTVPSRLLVFMVHSWTGGNAAAGIKGGQEAMKSQTIDEVCAAHRRSSFFSDGTGLIGVYNHRNVIFWYRWQANGYTLVGETRTPQGATKHKVESGPISQ